MAIKYGDINNETQLYTSDELNNLISGVRTAVGTASGTDAYVLTLSPALTSYAFGQVFDIKFTNACTGVCTLNINGIGAKNILKNGSLALKSGDILAGQVFSLFYDGTQFQLIGRVSTYWKPPSITLGDGIKNGASIGSNSGAGVYVSFSPSSNNEYLFNIGLSSNGLDYDGSDIIVELNWMKFGTSGGTIIWEVDYAFVELGQDAYSVSDGTLSETINVTPIANQKLQSLSFSTISGTAGAKMLQLTLRRKSSGAGSDTYSGDGEMYSFNLK